MEWFIKANIVLALFAMLFRVILKPSGRFQIARGYLILAPALSMVLSLNIHSFMIQPSPVLIHYLREVTSDSVQTGIQKTDVLLMTLLYFVYFSGFSMSLIWTTIRLFKIKRLRSRTAYSFLNTIHLPETSEANLLMMQVHEEAHVKQKHSVDILYFEFVKAVYWFNPFVYLMRKDLKEMHEFAADAYTIKHIIDRVAYCELILDATFQTAGTSTLVNSFHNQTSILNRIKMITQEKNQPLAGWRYLAALSILVVAVMISLTVLQAEAQGKLNAVKTADVMPELKGGQDGMSKFIGENLVYPSMCKEQKLQGLVVLQFIVDTKGKVNNVTNLSKPEVNELFVKEATRVVNMMEWSPGKDKGKLVNVEVVLPIRFSL